MTKEAVMETPKVKCEIVTEKGRVERIHFREPIDAQLAKNYKAAGCIITPATAIPDEVLVKVRARLESVAKTSNMRDIHENVFIALTLLGDTP